MRGLIFCPRDPTSTGNRSLAASKAIKLLSQSTYGIDAFSLNRFASNHRRRLPVFVHAVRSTTDWLLLCMG